MYGHDPEVASCKRASLKSTRFSLKKRQNTLYICIYICLFEEIRDDLDTRLHDRSNLCNRILIGGEIERVKIVSPVYTTFTYVSNKFDTSLHNRRTFSSFESYTSLKRDRARGNLTYYIQFTLHFSMCQKDIAKFLVDAHFLVWIVFVI